MIDYSLGENSAGPVTLEIKDSKGEVVRRYASTDPVPPEDPKLKIPRYWVRPPRVLSDKPGMHRFFWDMHGKPLPEIEPEYPMTAVYRETAPQPTAPWVLPGSYSVVLTAGGKSFTQPLTLKMDPRVKANEAELTKQFELSKRLQDLRAELQPIGKSYEALVGELEKARERAGGASVNQAIEDLRKKLEEFANPSAVRSDESLELDVLKKVEKLFDDLQEVDAGPTPQQEIALGDLQRDDAVRAGAMESDTGEGRGSECATRSSRPRTDQGPVGDFGPTMPQVDLAEYLRASRRILVFTGAGISTGSGIADFRGPQGVWTRRQPVYYEDFMTSEAARIEHWDYKLEAWESFRKAQPNDVHRAIVRLEQAEKLRMVVTQNIDGLHSLAGTSAGAAGRAARHQLARRMSELQKAE